MRGPMIAAHAVRTVIAVCPQRIINVETQQPGETKVPPRALPIVALAAYCVRYDARPAQSHTVAFTRASTVRTRCLKLRNANRYKSTSTGERDRSSASESRSGGTPRVPSRSNSASRGSLVSVAGTSRSMARVGARAAEST